MRIVLASSEAVPFSKTGGLADVTSALAKALDRAGHTVWLFTPLYRSVKPPQAPTLLDERLSIPVGRKRPTGMLKQTTLPGTNVTVFFVDQPGYFDREGLYQANGRDHADNCERFVFFSRSVMEAIRLLDLRPEIIHAHDWQTGLIPALLRTEYRHQTGFESAASVFTIHNLAFQGQFWHWDMLLTGLDWKYFNWKQMEAYNHLNLLKTGIVFTDMITTVSPTYAQEIQAEESGCGLHGVLAQRRSQLVGILNGVDTDEWNPKTDRALVANYDADDFESGKSACKADLQQAVGLPVRKEALLFGMISRMTDQKGFDLIQSASDEILKQDVQLCFLGSGERKYEEFLRELAGKWPKKVSTTIGFNESLAHRIEAGSDAYLMPSLFEPCGLNQMYSMIYGTVPIVRRVGGLADSVVDATLGTVAARTANGFSFTEYSPLELIRSVERAVESFNDRPLWDQLVQTGMRRDWSWQRSAEEYIAVYERAARNRGYSPAPALSSVN